MLEGSLNTEKKISEDVDTVEGQKEGYSNSTFKCDDCRENCSTKTSFKKHRKQNHPTKRIVNPSEENSLLDVIPNRKLECGLCVVDFENIEEINDHTDQHHQGRFYFMRVSLSLAGPFFLFQF